MRKVIVNRTKWYRGHGDHESRLLRRDGQLCCIGFACIQGGVPARDILEIGTVVAIDLHEKGTCKIPEDLRPKDRPQATWLDRAYSLNDNTCYDDMEREAQLIKLGAANGIEFVFIN